MDRLNRPLHTKSLLLVGRLFNGEWALIRSLTVKDNRLSTFNNQFTYLHTLENILHLQCLHTTEKYEQLSELKVPLHPGGCNSRHMNGEIPTLENLFDPVLEEYLEKDMPVLEKSSQRYA